MQLELLILAALIAAFITWRVASLQPPPAGVTQRFSTLLTGASLGTGFLAVPMFLFLIIVTLEEIIFLAVRLCIKIRNDCITCLLVWVGLRLAIYCVNLSLFAQQDIVNSTLVGILFFLSTVASAGLSVIWIDTVPYTSDAIRGEVALFVLITVSLTILNMLTSAMQTFYRCFTSSLPSYA